MITPCYHEVKIEKYLLSEMLGSWDILKAVPSFFLFVCLFTRGWGLTIPEDWSSQADILKQAMLPTVSQSECERDNKDAGIPVTDAMFCTGHGGSSPISTCNTDSGGPIVCKDWTGRWYLQGVVSWGTGGCHPGHYSVNARVSKYRNWIESYTMG